MGVAGALRSWWSDLQVRNEYRALPETERAAIARDIRVPEVILDRIVEQRTSGPLELPRLLDVLHLDAAKVVRSNPGVMRDLEVTCAGCCVHARCRSDLDRGAVAYEAYCPNASTIEALVVEEARQARA